MPAQLPKDFDANLCLAGQKSQSTSGMSANSLSPASILNLQRLEVRGRDGSAQKEVLIVWDIENARIPIGAPVEEVEK